MKPFFVLPVVGINADTSTIPKPPAGSVAPYVGSDGNFYCLLPDGTLVSGGGGGGGAAPSGPPFLTAFFQPGGLPYWNGEAFLPLGLGAVGAILAVGPNGAPVWSAEAPASGGTPGTLAGDSDVDESTGPQDGQVLTWSAAEGKWKPVTPAAAPAGGGATTGGGGGPSLVYALLTAPWVSGALAIGQWQDVPGLSIVVPPPAAGGIVRLSCSMMISPLAGGAQATARIVRADGSLIQTADAGGAGNSIQQTATYYNQGDPGQEGLLSWFVFDPAVTATAGGYKVQVASPYPGGASVCVNRTGRDGYGSGVDARSTSTLDAMVFPG